MATASMLMCAHVRRGLLRETADFVAKFKDGFEAGFVAADLLKKLGRGGRTCEQVWVDRWAEGEGKGGVKV
jgi:hypothetical protein